MAVSEIHRTFALETKKKIYAFHRSRLSQSLLAHMATYPDNAGLHSQQLQVLHDV